MESAVPLIGTHILWWAVSERERHEVLHALWAVHLKQAPNSARNVEPRSRMPYRCLARLPRPVRQFKMAHQ